MQNINNYKNKVNLILDELFINKINNNKLKNICAHAINGGKRLRPMITLDIVNSLNKIKNTNINADYASIASELLHTACLIIDDLPCMDNDNERRNNATIHYKYGETHAHLTTLYLIQQSYNLLFVNLNQLLKEKIIDYNRMVEIKLFLFNNLSSQLKKATKGQLLDIYPLKLIREGKTINGKISIELLKKIIKKKTTPFFDIAFIVGYIIGGGNNNNIYIIKKIADLFGLVFQIYDDFEDQEQDLNRGEECLILNYVLIAGKEKAFNDFNKAIKDMKILLNKLKLNSELFEEIFKYLEIKVNYYYYK